MNCKTAAVRLVPLVVLSLWAMAGPAGAEDVFYSLPFSDLKITEGTLPREGNRLEKWANTLHRSAVLDGSGEVYFGNVTFGRGQEGLIEGLTIRSPQAKDVSGTLFIPTRGGNEYQRVRFHVPESAARADAQEGAQYLFREAKAGHYQRLLNRNVPGAAWFRHRIAEAHGFGPAMPAAQRGLAGTDTLEDTYSLFTGGRAISENLQLDRLLPPTEAGESLVAIGSIRGITVQEMDWKGKTQGLQPALDPLAGFVPEDQHALFFPSFQAMISMMDEADAAGTPILEALEPRSEDSRTRERYERQLCLSASTVARLFGPAVIASVALTGSDPYLRTGTDLAVLFEAKNASALSAYITNRQAEAKAQTPDCRSEPGTVEGIAYAGVRSLDRTVCSYLATMGNVVVVTNSLGQLQRIVGTSQGKSPALGASPEYRFFRSRYVRGAEDESAFLILTDATIRRWCGPRWRIGASRQIRAAAVLSDLQAMHADSLVRKAVQSVRLDPAKGLVPLGEVHLGPEGVRSSAYGTLGFLTPISELPLDRVTTAEAQAYERWRDGYQQNWRRFFDPIAIRFSVRPDRLAADLSVMPLIAGTEYREFIRVTDGADLAPTGGDRHAGALVHLAIAINEANLPFRQAAEDFLQRAARDVAGSAFGWLGSSVEVYADEDPFWDELLTKPEPELQRFLTENFHRLPVAVRLEIKEPLKAALFLSTVRAFINQTAPGMVSWETRKHQGQDYVSVRGRDNLPQFTIFYSTTPEALTLTLNEPLLHRALDRQGARRKAREQNEPVPSYGEPWQGKDVALRTGPGVVRAMQTLTHESYQHLLQGRAWGNIPILNEWKRRYPDRDPVEVHERLWKTRLACPGGGRYVWNDRYQSMESTVFGHPGEPKTGAPLPPILSALESADFGLTFEDSGLRARVLLHRAAGQR